MAQNGSEFKTQSQGQSVPQGATSQKGEENESQEKRKKDKGPEEGEETRSQQAAHGPVHGP
jgi:hypothetical protein